LAEVICSAAAIARREDRRQRRAAAGDCRHAKRPKSISVGIARIVEQDVGRLDIAMQESPRLWTCSSP